MKELILIYEEVDIYMEMDEVYNEQKNILLNKHKVYFNDFKNFVETTKKSKYTKFIKSKRYNFFFNKFKNIFYSYDVKFNNCIYISMKNFTNDAYLFADEIIDTYCNMKNLIIDLRDNTGGNLEACIRIAKKLLPKCELLNLKYKNKEVTHYNINDCAFNFEKIFIFVNENTKSCGEIFSLMLRILGKNVYLIGNSTYGKEIGQLVITNNKYGYIYSLVSFQWNVRGKKISNIQEYLKIDNRINSIFKSEDDYYNMVLKLI